MPAIRGGAIQGSGRLLAQLSSLAGIDGAEAMAEGANVILPYMKSITPVDTGELRDSEIVEVDGKNVFLVAGAGHADYVELGTYKMQAQPFMRPAIDAKQKEANKAVAENIKSQFKRRIGLA